MFASLHCVDLGVTFPTSGNLVHLIQADHRAAAEVVDSGAVSTLLAIARCLYAHEFAAREGYAEHRVFYHVGDEPPPFLAYAVNIAGAAIARDVGPELAALPP